MKKFFNIDIFILLALVLFAAFYRLLTFEYEGFANFNPIIALSLFSGAFFTRKGFAVAAPIAAMFVSDLIIGFHDAMPAVYISLIAAILLGYLMLSSKTSPFRVISASLAASIVFFFITNFWVWAVWSYYSHDMSGFLLCYESALPFFRTSIIGDLLYSGFFFGSFALAGKYFPALSEFKSRPLYILK